jgi:PIN domain nuclease of toxin-antitoxin system
MASQPTHIVDASALIAYFKQEAGHENFSSLLADEQNVLAIHATNLCEVYYGYLRADGLEKAEDAW